MKKCDLVVRRALPNFGGVGACPKCDMTFERDAGCFNYHNAPKVVFVGEAGVMEIACPCCGATWHEKPVDYEEVAA